MRSDVALFALELIGLGGGVCAWGMLKLRKARNAARTLAAEAGECVCSAHFPSCICEHNPRGAGRGRFVVLGPGERYRAPPTISKCKNLRAYGPSPCHYPACDCFKVCGDDAVSS